MITTKNIIAIYKLANPSEIKHGLTWYVNATKDCKEIAIKYDLPIHIVIGVVSALSPNNKWERNIVNADDLCKAFIDGQDMDSIKVSTYHKMKQKAWSILEQMPSYDETIKILNGKKIVSFFKNISGDESDITIDGHARNIYYNDRQGLTTPNTNIRKLEYLDIQKAYLRASKKLGIKAYELQAITWLAWRRIHGIK
jgi:hypothetical protein|tara:strand:+ start:536 stop:1126 length:591 start_codon:yes stop_codon:yes gene_type:complete